MPISLEEIATAVNDALAAKQHQSKTIATVVTDVKERVRNLQAALYDLSQVVDALDATPAYLPSGGEPAGGYHSASAA